MSQVSRGLNNSSWSGTRGREEQVSAPSQTCCAGGGLDGQRGHTATWETCERACESRECSVCAFTSDLQPPPAEEEDLAVSTYILCESHM